MSLYTSVYWTKRVFVVFSLIIFICSGIRIFQFVSDRLSVRHVEVGSFKAEAGYGKIPSLELSSINEFSSFRPERFRISTTSGNLNAENGYPLETTANPLANVYKITERSIDLSTTQEPARVARDMGFISTANVTTTVSSWNEGNRTLTIDGLYDTYDYSNKGLRIPRQSTVGSLTSQDQAQLKSIYQKILTEYKIPFPFDSYTFTIQYLDYDSTKDDFVPSGIGLQGSYYRIDAKRVYPNLSKGEKANAFAAYPSYSKSNNYMILVNSNFTKALDNLVEMKLFSWPINTVVSSQNNDIQTYSIKTPAQAYDELTKYRAFLVSVKETNSNNEVKMDDLNDIDIVDVLTVRLDFYEEPVLKKYIQPVYVFLVEAKNRGVKYNLIYYVPALKSEHLLQ